MIKTEAGEKMKQENPVEEKTDINLDGKYEAWEQARQEAIAMAQKFEPETPEMNMGGLMHGGMGVIIGIEKESGNEIPAGSKAEEVADDIPAMLSEGEYVVPADVVRWHGVKTFEQMRCEAKMGMGLMAEDGRIAEVEEDEEYEHGHESPEYEIEEKDKPEVEEAEYEVVEAAEGVTTADSSTLGVATNPNYTLASRYNPDTNRIEYYYLDPVTGQEVSQEEFQPDQSTRFDPTETIMREVYGRTGDEIPDCGEGFVYDEVSGSCVPVEQPVTTPSTGMGGDGPDIEPYTPQYSEKLGTKIAEALGPLSAEDLAKQPGATLAEKAMSRMTTPTTAKSFIPGPVGMVITGVQKFADEVGASRAALTRANEISTLALGLDSSQLPRTYNYTFDPETASFNATSTTKITELQAIGGGGSWATNYDHTDPTTGEKVDPFAMTDAEWESWIDKVDEADFGKTDPNRVVGEGTGTAGPAINVDKSSTSYVGASDYSAGLYAGDTSQNDSNDNQGSQSNDVAGFDDPTSDDYGELNKGGYVTKKNTPKTAMIKYSKGSK